MTLAASNHPLPASVRDRLEYRVYLAAAFLVFLPAALIGRCLPRRMRPFGRNTGRVSAFEEATTAARNVAPWIFMG
ncbi:MAG: hypothetical protein ACKVS5_15355 [Parvularculaceae bacterium]